MTEAEWLKARNPSRLLDIARTTSPRLPMRKLRLYICTCCRRLPNSTVPDQLREALEVVERYLDGEVALDDLNQFRQTRPVLPRTTTNPEQAFRVLAQAVLGANARLWDAAKQTGNIVPDLLNADMSRDEEPWRRPVDTLNEREKLCRLLHDIFGNPFHPRTVAPEWHTDTVTAIARQMYESRDFGAMPILADALQDAGCDADDILNHCRDANATHVRGCWVVDLVLGKT